VVALGGDVDPHRAASALAARGPLTIVKDGERGAFAVDRDGASTADAGSPTDVVDTTGAGDTFDAAFLATWLDGADVAGALRRAVAAGRHSVAHTGGTAGQPTDADLPEADPVRPTLSGGPL
jgi:ribokinase